MRARAALVDSYVEWLAEVTHDRDASHGMEHFLRVRDAAVSLALEEQHLSERELLLLELAALSHDLLDHKYVAPEKAEQLRTAMRGALQERAALSPRDVGRVELIADNISLSKELRGELQFRELEACCCVHLRDLVSDADKLEALGRAGLVRLAQYQAHLLSASQLTTKGLREVAEEHLLHRVHYLRTEVARALGQGLLEETKVLLRSESSLGEVVSEAIATIKPLGNH